MRFVADTPEDYLAITFLQKFMTQVFKGEDDKDSALSTATKKFMNANIDKSYERPGDSVKNANISEYDSDEKELILPYIVMAATSRRKLALVYADTRGNQSKRIIEPFNWRNGQLVAWCHERNAWRQFKLSQIKRIAITEDGFERPEPVDIKHEDAKNPHLLSLVN